MPIQLYSAPMKYKDQNGDYQNIIGISGNPGRGIASVVLNNDYTLTINFTDNTSTTTGSIRGNGIESIEKTSTAGVVDTYTITDSDGGTSTFTIENGVTPSLSIGTVIEGQTAAATITGTADAPVLNLVLPAANLSTKADKADTVLDTTLSRGRKDNTTVGTASLAFGVNAEASGYYSVALGLNTTAASQGAFAEGKGTTAHYIAHAEGENTEANGQWSHSEGVDTIANGAASHAGGDNTIANGHSSFVTGRYNVADSYDNWPFWAANTSYSIGDKVKREQLVNNEATIVGYICKEANTDESFDISHWDFDVHHMNFAAIVGNGYEAEDPTTHEMVRHGSNAYALDWDGNGYFAGDVYVGADADSANGTKLVKESDVPIEYGSGVGSIKSKDFIVGTNSNISQIANGLASAAFGYGTKALGDYTSVEGFRTIALNATGHSEGTQSFAYGNGTHAEGYNATGYFLTLSGNDGDVVYNYSTSSLSDFTTDLIILTADNHAAFITAIDSVNKTITVSNTLGTLNNERVTVHWSGAIGEGSHTEGSCNIAKHPYMHVQGKWNHVSDQNLYADVIGNGSTYNARSNAYALTWTGDGHYAGDVYVHSNADSSGGTKLATIEDIPDAPVQDVQVNGVSVLDAQGVANVPVASTTSLGVSKYVTQQFAVNNMGQVSLRSISAADYKTGTSGWGMAVQPLSINALTFYGLAKAAGDTTQSASSNAVGTYTDNAKASIKSMLGIVDGSTGTVDITGTTPTITAVENTRYVCGEVSTLSFTPPASGISIVRFTSGTTATVLTLPSTVKFPEWFDATALEADTIYELCITDGIYGAVMSWAL